MGADQLLAFWWVLPIVASLLFYKTVLRFFFGMVIVPENKMGLVTKKFVLFGKHKEMPDGRIIATQGEAGFQAQTLAPGIYFWKWMWQFVIQMEEFTVIPEGKIGLVLARDGAEIPTGSILARKVDCDNFQDAERFLTNGGQRGRQTTYITAGSYRVNTLLFHITIADMIRIQESMIGIITTLDGLPIDSGQIAGKMIEGHNNFQDFDQFLEHGGNRGLQPQVVPPDSLMKTLTDRKIAEEQKVTYETQREAQETRQGMEKETAIADMQRQIVSAQQSVEIAERTANAAVKKSEGEAASVRLSVSAESEATKLRAHAEAEAMLAKAQAESESVKLRADAHAQEISLTGDAEASKILAIGKSTAEAYELAVEALGSENFTRFKITEELAKGRIKLMPEVLIGGGGNGNGQGNAMEGMLGLRLLELMDPEQRSAKPTPKKKGGAIDPQQS
jgi:uncharacterized membrane protein YqiK